MVVGIERTQQRKQQRRLSGPGMTMALPTILMVVLTMMAQLQNHLACADGADTSFITNNNNYNQEVGEQQQPEEGFQVDAGETTKKPETQEEEWEDMHYYGNPNILSVRRLQAEQIKFEFNITAAYVFPQGFEFPTTAPGQPSQPVRQLRGAVRFTQLFYRRWISQQYPESYLNVTTRTIQNNEGTAGVFDGFPYIQLFIITEVTYQLVGVVPSPEEAFAACLANNANFFGGRLCPPCFPGGFDPEDYLGFIMQVDPPTIFGEVMEASVIDIQRTPTPIPSALPTFIPSHSPSQLPSFSPSSFPSNSPSVSGTTAAPTKFMPTGSISPSNNPSEQPSKRPTSQPSGCPSNSPSKGPTPIPTPQPTPVPTVSPTSSDDGDFMFTGTNQNVVPQTDFNLISQSFEPLNRILTTDLLNVETTGVALTFNPNARQCVIPFTVDDLHICISYNPDLLNTDILGRAGIIQIRPNNTVDEALPFVSAFDLRPDLADHPEILQTVVRRFALLCLGVGTLWDHPRKNLIFRPDPNDPNYCRYNPNTFASLEFRRISEDCQGESFAIPLEPSCNLWEGDCFDDQDVVSGNPTLDDLDEDHLPVISRVSMGSLADLGYRNINYNYQNSTFDIDGDDFSRECRCRGRRRELNWIPPISDEALTLAESHGMGCLNELNRLFVNSGKAGTEEGKTFVGDKAVAVLVQDGKYTRQVIVKREPYF